MLDYGLRSSLVLLFFVYLALITIELLRGLVVYYPIGAIF